MYPDGKECCGVGTGYCKGHVGNVPPACPVRVDVYVYKPTYPRCRRQTLRARVLIPRSVVLLVHFV
jgi:hypothetical protein